MAKDSIKRETHHIDVDGKVLGRISSEIAHILRGKHKVDWQPHIDSGDFVVVSNVAKIKVTGNKMTQKTYYRTSQYLGNLKAERLEELWEKKGPQEALRKAVHGMLPHNTLRPSMMKRLTILQ